MNITGSTKKKMINGYDFKGDSTPLIKYFSTKPVSSTTKNPQASNTVNRVHQVIYIIIVMK